jgi:hypothetical protein
MGMLERSIRVIVSIGALLFADPATALTVTLNPGGWQSAITDRAVGVLDADEPITNLNAFPASGTTTPGAAFGGASSLTSYALSNDGFDIGFDQTIAQDFYSGSQAWAGIIFSVDEDVAYQIVGGFGVTGVDAGRYRLTTTLRDITGAPALLFESMQWSWSTPGESFTVGELGGDDSNVLEGSQSGTLLAGHRYTFFAEASLETYPEAPRLAPVSGTGGVSLYLVPEPSPALLVGLGLMALAALRRR